jgi:hypothetical protein
MPRNGSFALVFIFVAFGASVREVAPRADRPIRPERPGSFVTGGDGRDELRGPAPVEESAARPSPRRLALFAQLGRVCTLGQHLEDR